MRVTIKWNKDIFDNVDIGDEKDLTQASLRSILQRLTSVPTDRQKLQAKGLWIGFLKEDADISKLNIKEGQVIVVMGTAEVFEEAPPSVASPGRANIPPQKNGLQNLGNTSYINAVIQSLSHVLFTDSAAAAAAGRLSPYFNRAGVPISLGSPPWRGQDGGMVASSSTSSSSSMYYCSRVLGRGVIPGRDGQCGPASGPQCSDCYGITASSRFNRAGFLMTQSTSASASDGANRSCRMYYCGRTLGLEAIPGSAFNGSDGQCGPNNGPQCSDCSVSSSSSLSSMSSDSIGKIEIRGIFFSLLSKLSGPRVATGILPIEFISMLRTEFPQFSEKLPDKDVYKELEASIFLDFVAEMLNENSTSNPVLNLQLIESCNLMSSSSTGCEKVNCNKLQSLVYNQSHTSLPISNIMDGIKYWMSSSAYSIDAATPQTSLSSTTTAIKGATTNVIVDHDGTLFARRRPGSQLRLASLPRIICVKVNRFWGRPSPSLSSCFTSPPTSSSSSSSPAHLLSLSSSSTASGGRGGSTSCRLTINKFLTRVTFESSLDVLDICSEDLRNALIKNREFSSVDHHHHHDSTAAVAANLFDSDVSPRSSGFFDLQSIIAHQGTYSDGHYISYVKDNSSTSSSSLSSSSSGNNHNCYWWRFSDKEVAVVSNYDVMNLIGGGDGETAYLLFYKAQN